VVTPQDHELWSGVRAHSRLCRVQQLEYFLTSRTFVVQFSSAPPADTAVSHVSPYITLQRRACRCAPRPAMRSVARSTPACCARTTHRARAVRCPCRARRSAPIGVMRTSAAAPAQSDPPVARGVSVALRSVRWRAALCPARARRHRVVLVIVIKKVTTRTCAYVQAARCASERAAR
jgi:hypothetical protein